MTTPDFTPSTPTSGVVPDFTPVSDVQFTLYGETFYGVVELTLEDSFNYENLAMQFSDTNRTVAERVESMKTVLRTLLQPDSADRLIAGLNDRQKPIGLTTVMKIFKYIMETYGERPTNPGSDSSVGSDNPESGTPSTVSSPVEASMS